MRHGDGFSSLPHAALQSSLSQAFSRDTPAWRRSDPQVECPQMWEMVCNLNAKSFILRQSMNPVLAQGSGQRGDTSTTCS